MCRTREPAAANGGFQDGGNDDSRLPAANKPSPRRTQHDAAGLIAALAGLWPQAFAVYERRRRPLKLGIHQDIDAAAGGAITPEEIEAALRSYTWNVGYLLACKEGAARIDLDGQPAGHVTADEAGHAARLVAYKRRLAAERRKRDATEIPAPPANTPPPRLSLSDLRAAAAERRQREAQP